MLKITYRDAQLIENYNKSLKENNKVEYLTDLEKISKKIGGYAFGIPVVETAYEKIEKANAEAKELKDMIDEICSDIANLIFISEKV